MPFFHDDGDDDDDKDDAADLVAGPNWPSSMIMTMIMMTMMIFKLNKPNLTLPYLHYRSGLTSLQERLQDSGSIHYPREATTDRGENNSVERSVKMFV